jgi:hypothetical protein
LFFHEDIQEILFCIRPASENNRGRKGIIPIKQVGRKLYSVYLVCQIEKSTFAESGQLFLAQAQKDLQK